VARWLAALVAAAAISACSSAPLRRAVLELGSGATKLHVIELDHAACEFRAVEQRIVKLKLTDAAGGDAAAMHERCVAVLDQLMAASRALAAPPLHFALVATEGLRRHGGETLLASLAARVRERWDHVATLSHSMLGQDEEGRLGLLSAFDSLVAREAVHPSCAVALDIGGGSMQLSYASEALDTDWCDAEERGGGGGGDDDDDAATAAEEAAAVGVLKVRMGAEDFLSLVLSDVKKLSDPAATPNPIGSEHAVAATSLCRARLAELVDAEQAARVRHLIGECNGAVMGVGRMIRESLCRQLQRQGHVGDCAHAASIDLALVRAAALERHNMSDAQLAALVNDGFHRSHGTNFLLAQCVMEAFGIEQVLVTAAEVGVRVALEPRFWQRR
jgi:hypothetical protein